mmetsp:Transcript_33814/g.79700  ORF Transcript_33814/g.79700 Transcript_33814/m.79700 type:complete len:121 (-) Transcript_33814:990-1352(-)
MRKAINLKKKLGYYFVTIIHKASLRFGVASTALSVLVVGGEKGNVDPMVKRERCLAYWSGVEVGFWYSVGYLAQAEALQTVAAGKVRWLQKILSSSVLKYARLFTFALSNFPYRVPFLVR